MEKYMQDKQSKSVKFGSDEEVNALIPLPQNELLLSREYVQNRDVLFNALKTTYDDLSPELQRTYEILFHTESTQNCDEGAKGSNDVSSGAMADAMKIAAGITEYLTKYLVEENISRETNVSHLARMAGIAFRMHPSTITDDGLQKAITTCLITGKPIDLSDIISTDYYIGPQAKGNGNVLLRQYFEEVPFKISAEFLSNRADPVDDVIKDWYRAVTYCRNHGLPGEAILRDGTPLLRFAPDCIPWVKDNLDEFPGLDSLSVNNGVYIDQWLRNTLVGTTEGCTTHRAWLVLLTGYTPEVNEYVGVDRRYSEAGLSAALGITIDNRTT